MQAPTPPYFHLPTLDDSNRFMRRFKIRAPPPDALRRLPLSPMSRRPPSIPSLLRSCKTLKTLKLIHALAVVTRSDHHPLVAPRLLLLSVSLSPSSLSYAAALLRSLRRPSLLLSAFPSLLRSLALRSSLPSGSALHARLLRLGLHSDPFLQTALLHFYSKCRLLADARRVFDGMPHRSVVTWTAMVGGYLSSGDLAGARKVFDEMPERNVVSWNLMADGYAKAGDMVGARRLFEEMPVRSAAGYTAMVDGFAKAGDVATARWFFDEGRDCRDAFLWSAMISGYVQNGSPTEALKVFFEMYEKRVEPDDHIVVGLVSACSKLNSLSLAKWADEYVARSRVDIKKPHLLSALVDMNAKCGNMERATKLFGLMSTRDLISYSSLMKGYSIHGCGEKTIELFSQMLKEKIAPDVAAFTIVLNACSHVGLVEEGKHYFELMKSDYSIVPTRDHYACMVDLLGRAGQLQEAYGLVQAMPMEPHAGVLGALLGACGLHGNIELGEIVGQRLFEIEPENAANYVLLSNIYASADRWTKVYQLREMMKARGLRKVPGCTRV